MRWYFCLPAVLRPEGLQIILFGSFTSFCSTTLSTFSVIMSLASGHKLKATLWPNTETMVLQCFAATSLKLQKTFVDFFETRSFFVGKQRSVDS